MNIILTMTCVHDTYINESCCSVLSCYVNMSYSFHLGSVTYYLSDNCSLLVNTVVSNIYYTLFISFSNSLFVLNLYNSLLIGYQYNIWR